MCKHSVNSILRVHNITHQLLTATTHNQLCGILTGKIPYTDFFFEFRGNYNQYAILFTYHYLGSWFKPLFLMEFV